MRIELEAVLVGNLKPLGDSGVESGIDKQAVAGRVKLLRLGLEGDRVGDRRHHGGPEKALHHYAHDHYAWWRAEMPGIDPRLFDRGGFGENISTTGMTEVDVCIGDVFRVGGALIQVSQGRQPCWRLNERFAETRMAVRVQQSGRTGWYYRVIEEGHVAVGQEMVLIERPCESWPVKRALELMHRRSADPAELAQLVLLRPLSESWRSIARMRLASGVTEDWSRRLGAHACPESGSSKQA